MPTGLEVRAEQPVDRDAGTGRDYDVESYVVDGFQYETVPMR